MKLKSILQAVDVNKLQFIRKHLPGYLTLAVLVCQTTSCSSFSSGVVKSLLTQEQKKVFTQVKGLTPTGLVSNTNVANVGVM